MCACVNVTQLTIIIRHSTLKTNILSKPLYIILHFTMLHNNSQSKKLSHSIHRNCFFIVSMTNQHGRSVSATLTHHPRSVRFQSTDVADSEVVQDVAGPNNYNTQDTGFCRLPNMSWVDSYNISIKHNSGLMRRSLLQALRWFMTLTSFITQQFMTHLQHMNWV